MFEHHAGTAGLGKGFQAQNLGRVVGYSEHNDTLHKHLQKLFPKVFGVHSHAEVTGELLTALKVVYFIGGAPCPPHSSAN